jgi:hypothetical protein
MTWTALDVGTNADGRLELFAFGIYGGSVPAVWHVSQPAPSVHNFLSPPGAIGIVLAGGGTPCDFQVGALRYLRDIVGITGGIVCGTSFGALNGAKFAEGNLDQLQEFWLSLQWPDDILAEESWFGPPQGYRGNAWLVNEIEKSQFSPVTVPSPASALVGPSAIVKRWRKACQPCRLYREGNCQQLP